MNAAHVTQQSAGRVREVSSRLVYRPEDPAAPRAHSFSTFIYRPPRGPLPSPSLSRHPTQTHPPPLPSFSCCPLASTTLFNHVYFRPSRAHRGRIFTFHFFFCCVCLFVCLLLYLTRFRDTVCESLFFFSFSFLILSRCRVLLPSARRQNGRREMLNRIRADETAPHPTPGSPGQILTRVLGGVTLSAHLLSRSFSVTWAIGRGERGESARAQRAALPLPPARRPLARRARSRRVVYLWANARASRTGLYIRVYRSGSIFWIVFIDFFFFYWKLWLSAIRRLERSGIAINIQYSNFVIFWFWFFFCRA